MGAWSRHVFEKIGLFDEELVRDQDDEFNCRLRAAGGRILLRPQIKSEYTVRGNPLSLWRQYYQYGFWKVRVLQKHPRQMRPRQFLPPLFVVSLWISIFLFFVPPLRVFSNIIPLAYLIASFGVSFFATLKHGWKLLPLLPMILAILHLSYGIGFLVGLVHFANRWGDKQGSVPVLINRDTTFSKP
jgi:GT2 family glycosyltransferase